MLPASRLFADVVTIQPGPEGTDAFVAQMNGGMNFGSSTALASGQGPDFGGSEKRSFLQFNLSSIPTGATINSATLSLYVSQAAGGAQTASAYKVTSTWDEAAVNWNSQPSSDATAVSSVAVNSVGWKSWAITSLVASWCNGSVTNNGVLVKQSSGSPPNNVQFYSGDYGGDATLRPKLVVDYTTVNNPPTAVSLNAPTNITDTSISLSWSQNADADFQSYKLYRSTTAGVTEASTLLSTITSQTSTTYTDTGLTATTAYYYRVFVVDTGALSSGGSNEVSATTAATPPPPPSVANLSVSATPTSIVADGAAQSTRTRESAITATLTDVNNQPVADHAVDFTTSSGTLSAASATTNAQGNASVTLTSGTTAGTANITATSSGLTGTCSVTFTDVPPPPAPTLTVTANPSTLLADGASQSTITATLMDGNNQAIANETINFQTPAGTLSPTSATTNAQGTATVTLTSGTQAATPTITATSTSATGTCSLTFNAVPPPPATVSVAVTPNLITADGQSTATVSATIANNGQPVADGTTVTLTTTWGSYQGANPGSPDTLDTTTVNGVATVVLISSNTMPTGTSTVTVTASALGAQGQGTATAQTEESYSDRIVLKWLQPTCNIAPPCVRHGEKMSGGGAIHFYWIVPPGSAPIPNQPGALMGFTSFRAYEVAHHVNQEKLWLYLPNDLLLNQITCTVYTDPAQLPLCAPSIAQGETLLDFYTHLAPGWGTDDFHNGKWVVEANYWQQATPTSPVVNQKESIHIYLNNLLVNVTEDDDHPRLLKWVREGYGKNKTKVKFKLTCEGEVDISPQVRIYDLSRTGSPDPAGDDAIRVVTLATQKVTALGTTWEWDWDGQKKPATGYQTIPAQPGVYAFEVFADWTGPTCGGQHAKTSRFLSVYLPNDNGQVRNHVTHLGYDAATGKDSFEVSYILKDTRNTAAFAASVDLYKPTPSTATVTLKNLTGSDLCASETGISHTVTVEVDHSIFSEAGDYLFVVSATDDHKDDEKDHKKRPALEVGQTYSVALDLAVDSDNDATVVGDEPDDDPIEMNSPGKIIGANDDNDDWAAGGTGTQLEIDNTNDSIDGDDDKKDMAELVLREVGPYYQNPNGTLTLYVAEGDREKVRIFDQNDVAWIGPGSLGNSYQVPIALLLWDNLLYHVEGIQPGEVIVTLKYAAKNGVLDPGEDLNNNEVLDPGEDLYQEVCRDEVKITIVKVDLDVDTNRDGAIDDVADEDGEDNWTKTRGAIFNVNHDKDCDNLFGLGCPESDTVVFNDDGVPVEEDFTINGAGDCEDITRFVIRGLGSVLPPSLHLFLKVAEEEDIKSIHVFKRIAADENSIWGGLQATSLEKDITTNVNQFTDNTFGLEGLLFRNLNPDMPTTFDGEIDLTLELRANGNVIFSDKVRMKVAPWMMIPNTQSSLEVWAVDDGARNAVLKSALGGSGQLRLVDEQQITQFLQDHVEIGYTGRPGGPKVHSVFRLPCPRGDNPDLLPGWPLSRLLNGNTGVFTLGHNLGGGGGDYGGNLELMPPNDQYKLGRIVIGDNASPKMVKFLESQEVQAPLIKVDVHWLEIGHIDEVFLFTDTPNQVVVADPQKAFNLMNQIPVGQDRDRSVFFAPTTNAAAGGLLSDANGSLITPEPAHATANWKYVRVYDTSASSPTGDGKVQVGRIAQVVNGQFVIDWVWDVGVSLSPATVSIVAPKGPSWVRAPKTGDKYVLVEETKFWIDPVASGTVKETPAFVTVFDLLWDPDLEALNTGPIQARIDAIRAQLQTEAGGTLAFARVPVMYVGASSGSPPIIAEKTVTAFTPNLANCQVAGGMLYFPKQFAPRNSSGDIFEVAASSIVPNSVFADDWDTYHRYKGEVHCGTATRRTKPSLSWWENLP